MEFTFDERIVMRTALILRKNWVEELLECSKDYANTNELYTKELETINELLKKF